MLSLAVAGLAAYGLFVLVDGFWGILAVSIVSAVKGLEMKNSVGAEQFAAAQCCRVQVGPVQVGVIEQRVAQVQSMEVATVEVGALARLPARGNPLLMAVEDRNKIGRLDHPGEAGFITRTPVAHRPILNLWLCAQTAISAPRHSVCQCKNSSIYESMEQPIRGAAEREQRGRDAR